MNENNKDDPVNVWMQNVFTPNLKKNLFYSMRKGRCVIVNCLPEEQISKNLLHTMKMTFEELELECKLYQVHVDFDELKTVLETESRIDHSSYDCFLMFIFTEKERKETLFKNLSKSSEFRVNSIFDYFTGEESTLKGKPKMFFVQCHNQDEITTAVDSSVQHDGNPLSQIYELLAKLLSKYSYIPKYADFLLFYSPFPVRNFIKELCSILVSNIEYDLVSILTKLAHELQEEQIALRKITKSNAPWPALSRGVLKHVPYISSTLTRLISFNKANVDYKMLDNLSYSKGKQLRTTIGKCIIINIENYLNRPDLQRKNTKEHGLLIAKTFYNLGFRVKHYYDKNRAEIDNYDDLETTFNKHDQPLTKEVLRNILAEELKNDTDNGKRKYFVMWILTHGNENGILHCHDSSIRVNDLLDCFSEHYCPSLRGIPKLLFVVACKGDKYDQGMKVFHDAEQSKDRDFCCLPNDCLVCYSTYPGHISYRDWLINSVCKILQSENETVSKFDLMTILTIAFQYIAYKKRSNTLSQRPDKPEWDNKKLIPYINSTLTRLIELHADDDEESDDNDYY